jgi:hypothetical protein
MVSVLASSAVDRGLSHDRLKSETMKMVFVVSLLSICSIKEKEKELLGSKSG